MADIVVTRDQLRSRIRSRCDQAGSTFIGDTELDEMMNAAYAHLVDELYDVIDVEAFVSSVDDTTVAGTDVYTLSPNGGPSLEDNDLYRIAGVDVQFQGKWRSIGRWKFTSRNALNDVSGWSGPGDTFYKLHGHNQADGETRIRFYPTPQGVHSFRVWYMPIAFTIDATTPMLALNGWDEFVVCDVCAMILEKEESEAGPFTARRDRALRRVIWAAKMLDDSGTEGPRETVDWGDGDYFDADPPLGVS